MSDLPPLRDSMDAPSEAITITGPITIRVFGCITVIAPALTLPAGLPERFLGMILDRCSHPAPAEAAGRVPA